MNTYSILISFSVSLLMSFIAIPQIVEIAYRKKLYDIPSKRKLHTIGIPRLGGLAFFPVILFTLIIINALELYFNKSTPHFLLSDLCFLICALFILFFIGLKDDLVGCKYDSKLLFQFLSAMMIPLSGVWINNLYGLFGIYELPFWIGLPLTIFFIVFVINAINFIDGIDGLCSGLSIMSLSILSIIFLFTKNFELTILAFATLGTLLPFIYQNLLGNTQNMTKTFMGDTGSLTLGYILSFLIIHILYVPQSSYGNPPMMIILAISTLIIPLLDAFRVIIVRINHRKNIFEADNNHIHHKLLQLGINPRNSLYILLLLFVVYCSLNIFLIHYSTITVVFMIDILLWLITHMICNKLINIRISRSGTKEKHYLDRKNNVIIQKKLKHITKY